MRCDEIFSIGEGRDAALYHWMDVEKSLNVFIKDEMPGNWTHRLPTDPDKNVDGNSLTRDKTLEWGGMPLRITVDQTRLGQTNRIIPVDGHYVHRHTRSNFDWENVNSRTMRGKNANPSEEFVVGTIRALHRYILTIEFREFRYNEQCAALLDVVQAYGQKWNVPVSIDPTVFEAFEHYKERLKDLREPEEHKMHPDIMRYFPK